MLPLSNKVGACWPATVGRRRTHGLALQGRQRSDRVRGFRRNSENLFSARWARILPAQLRLLGPSNVLVLGETNILAAEVRDAGRGHGSGCRGRLFRRAN